MANNAASTFPSGVASGDLSGTYPGPIFVVNIHGASVPLAGSLITGNTLQVNGGGSLTYAPLNLAGGTNYVINQLPSANQVAQTMGGDVTGTTAASIISAISGVSPIDITPAELGWLSTVTAPILQQISSSTNSGTGQILTIQAQSMTGTSSHGGNLYLQSGTGTASDGYVSLICGNQTRLEVQDQLITCDADVSHNNYNIKLVKALTFDQEVANGNSGSSFTINWTLGNKQTLTLTAACTISFTAPLGPTNCLLRLVQGPGGGFTITWPSEGLSAGNLAWVGGTKPTLSTSAGANDIISIYYNNSLYFGSYGINFS